MNFFSSPPLDRLARTGEADTVGRGLQFDEEGAG